MPWPIPRDQVKRTRRARTRKRPTRPPVSDALRRLWQRLPWYVAPNTVEGRNLRSLYLDTVWFGVLSGLTATYVSVFALRLGATTGQLGWLTALPALVNIVWLIPAARLLERQRRPMPIVIATGVLQRVAYLAMVAVPLLAAGQVTALIILATVAAVPTAVINTAITALIPELISSDRRGSAISVRWLLLAAAETAAALIGGQLLGLMPIPLNYQVVIGAGTLLSLLSIPYLRRIRVPDTALRSTASLAPAKRPRRRFPRPQGQLSSLRRALSGILAQHGFVRFTAASFVFYWGIYLPSALWSILRVRELGASDGWIGLIATVNSLSIIAGYLYWGKAGARRGNRWMLITGTLGVTIFVFLTALVPTIEWMIPTSILGGVMWAGCNLALFNILLSVCPSDRRPTYIALHTSLINVTAFAGPLLGAALVALTGLRPVFVISAVLRGAGLLLFVLLLRGKITDAPR
jgi:MFS family permease